MGSTPAPPRGGKWILKQGWGQWGPAALITWNISIVMAGFKENPGLEEYREHPDHVRTMKCLGRSEGNSTKFKCVTPSGRVDLNVTNSWGKPALSAGP